MMFLKSSEYDNPLGQQTSSNEPNDIGRKL